MRLTAPQGTSFEAVSRLAAIREGNRDRLRPILMTSLALAGGMLPLALGAGPGAEERRTIAVVIIGGQMLALVVTLVLTPIAYSLLDDVRLAWRSRRARRRAIQQPAGEHSSEHQELI